MKIGILHLTDMHFTVKTDVNNKIDSLCRIIINESIELKKLYIVISGDLAFSGKKEEYEKVMKFLCTIKQLINAEINEIKISFIIVPGNHDCDFNYDSQLRQNIISKPNYSTIGNDDSIILASLKVQDPFWDFYSKYNQLPPNKLFYQIEDSTDDVKISFNCINTAWMSQINESVGSLFFPIKSLDDWKADKSKINIGIWHHPSNWFNPNTNENNTQEFQNFTERLGIIGLCGHEHTQTNRLIENRVLKTNTNILSGQVFNEDNHRNTSGFQFIFLNCKNYDSNTKAYSWSNGMYITTKQSENNLLIDKPNRTLFKLKKNFFNQIDDIKISLLIGERRITSLSSIYVYPDLDKVSSIVDVTDKYINSKSLLDSEYSNCIIYGESQIGKSSLIYRIYLDLLQSTNIIPILLKREHVNINPTRIIDYLFKDQYECSKENEFEKYSQLLPKERALLIDGIMEDETEFEKLRNILNLVGIKFGKIIITFDSANSILPNIRSEFRNYLFFSIKELGYKKRNELITRYHNQGENTSEYGNIQEIIKQSFDNIQSVLGKKLMPSYPIYILSILQALNYSALKSDETALGYCYQALIWYSLTRSGVKNEDIDSYINFLCDFAFYMIQNNLSELSDDDFLAFYQNYKKHFIIEKYDILASKINNARVVTFKESTVSFSYKYILYYLSAKKIAEILSTTEGQNIVKYMFEHVDIERNANILIFVTHHSKDISFIEECCIRNMIVLEKVKPITLNIDDPFYKELEDLAQSIKNNVIDNNRPPELEREKSLEEQDRLAELNLSHSEDEVENVADIETYTLPFKQAFRSIEIVGQIIKNRKGSLSKDILSDMILELYKTGFRTISYNSTLFESAKIAILNQIKDDPNITLETNFSIEQKISKLIQTLNLNICLAVFSKLIHCIGSKDLKELYEYVANEIGTPAAKLVSFSIISSYGKIKPSQVKNLAKEFEKNPVALNILKARTLSYIYNTKVDYKDQQQIANYLKLEFKNHNISNIGSIAKR